MTMNRSGFIGSIDTYAYRSPNAPEIDVGESSAEETSQSGEPTASLDREPRAEPASIESSRQRMADTEAASALAR